MISSAATVAELAVAELAVDELAVDELAVDELGTRVPFAGRPERALPG
jgi:hypothetical protein